MPDCLGLAGLPLGESSEHSMWCVYAGAAWCSCGKGLLQQELEGQRGCHCREGLPLGGGCGVSAWLSLQAHKVPPWLRHPRMLATQSWKGVGVRCVCAHIQVPV